LIGQCEKIVPFILDGHDDGDPWLYRLCHEERKGPARKPCGGITEGILQKGLMRFKLERPVRG
jgi:hypothetical protein